MDLRPVESRADEFFTWAGRFDSGKRVDAAFASAADVPALINEVKRLHDALRAVLAIHTPEKPRRDPDFHHTDRVCIECGDPFPCRTYTAVTAHIAYDKGYLDGERNARPARPRRDPGRPRRARPRARP